jgi:hypothetical protein
MAVGLTMPTVASAEFIFLDANREAAPYFVNQVYTGYTFDGGGDDEFGITNGILVGSNVAPIPMSTNNVTENHNGATVSVTSSVAPGAAFMSAHNTVSMTVANAQSTDGYYAVAGNGSRTQVQFFTPQVAAEHAVYHWRVTGTSGTPVGTAQARLDFIAGTGFTSFNDVFGSGALSVRGPGEYQFHLNAPLNQVIDLIYWSSAFTQVNRGEVDDGTTFTAFADFGSTYELTGIDLLDAAMQPITEWTLFDYGLNTTVFNQNGRVTATVAEPSTLVLLGAGLFGLGVLRRRKVAD